jgi:hypothetical protein
VRANGIGFASRPAGARLALGNTWTIPEIIIPPFAWFTPRFRETKGNYAHSDEKVGRADPD